MRLAWWGFIVVGVVLLGVGAFTTLTSQSTMDYCRSQIRTVACGAGGPGNAQPKFFMSEATTVSLQEAELTWVAGVAMVGLGLISTTYGAISKLWAEQIPLAAT
jgi:hypothetical protein